MESEFRKRLNAARLRLSANLLLEHAAIGLLAAGACAGAMVLVDKLLTAPLLTGRAVPIFFGVTAAAILATWAFKIPGLMEAALEVDGRLKVKERFSTTLALSASADPFAEAARQDAYATAAALDVSERFAIRPTRRWALAAGSWAIVGLLALYMPPLDLLGRRAAENRLALQEEQVHRAQADVQRTVSRVEAVVHQLGAADLAKELADLREITPGAPPNEIRRRAIRSLGDVADKLRQVKEGERGEAAELIRDMMKRLRVPSGGLGGELGRAMARGQFGKAADLARQMKDQLASKDLKAEDREALEKALKDLADQLQKLAQSTKDLEDALAKAGLSKDLAKLDPNALKQALQQSGLDPATVKKLLQKAQACKSACKNCGALAQAMAGACSVGGGGQGLSPDGLAVLGEQLDALEAARQQAALVQATLDEITNSSSALGAGMLGLAGAYRPTGSDEPGSGTGQRGQGFGPVETASGGPTATSGTRVSNPDRAGPVIATWYAHEEQIKGEARRQADPTVNAAKDRAAEAISDNVIPTKYHGSVKRYFDSLGGGGTEEEAKDDRASPGTPDAP